MTTIQSEIKKLRNRNDLDSLSSGESVRINEKGCEIYVLFEKKIGEEYFFNTFGAKTRYLLKPEDMSFEDGCIIINRQRER